MDLQQFLNEHTVENITDEVAISERFKDENGLLLKFTIRAISGDEINGYRQKCLKIVKKQNDATFDQKKFYELIVLNATVYPNFKDAASIQKLNCVTPENYLYKVLLAGEIEKLVKQILQLSGFDDDMDALRDQAKN